MIYNISADFDEQLYRQIAVESGSKQAVLDVKFARFLVNRRNADAITYHIADEAFLVACQSKSRIRIYGMATSERFKRGGRGSCLLDKLYSMATNCKISEIYTLTIDGLRFYLSKGFVITGKSKRGEYILTKRL